MFSRKAIETTSEQLNTKQIWMELFRFSKKNKKKLRTTDYGNPCILFLKKHAILCMYDTSKKRDV